MRPIETIRALQPRQEILEFAEFVYASAGNRQFPDMADIDLMQIPRLVPHIYVMDFRNGIEAGLLIKFAGTEVEKNFKQKLQGNYLDKTYTGFDRDQLVFGTYRQSYQNKQPFYTHRIVAYGADEKAEKHRLASVLFLICQNAEHCVDYGIGIAFYEFVPDDVADTFHWI